MSIGPRTADTLDQWSAGDLGLRPEECGLAGSPTLVTLLRNDEPTRHPTVVNEGTPGERARAAAELVGRTIATQRVEPFEHFLPPVGPLADDKEVLLLVASDPSPLSDASLSVISETCRRLPAHWPAVAWVGPPPSEESLVQLAGAGASPSVSSLEHDTTSGYCRGRHRAAGSAPPSFSV